MKTRKVTIHSSLCAAVVFAFATLPCPAHTIREDGNTAVPAAITAGPTARLETSSKPASTGEDNTKSPALPALPKPQAPSAKAEIPGLTYGLEERLRFEGYNNTDFNSVKNDTLDQLRMRTRAFADFNFNDYLEGYVRLGWEGVKRTTDPSYPLAPSGAEQASPFMAGELWFSSAFLKLRKFPGIDNVSLQAGRFDIVKGDSWLFNDPSGLDGSRDGYTNAFDLAYVRGKSKFELIGMFNPKYDEFFPVANATPIVDTTNPANSGTVKYAIPALAHVGKQLQEWDQTAIGIYYTNRERKNTDIEAYTFFNKSYADIRRPSYFMYLPDRHFVLFGGRVVQRIKRVPGLSVTGEFAYELGAENSMNPAFANFDLRAWGGFAYAKKSFDVKFKPYLFAGFWALSGQDPNSRTAGNFSPIFERSFNTSLTENAPCWSEFYSASYNYEQGVYFWTNLKMAQIEAGFTPVKQLTLVGGYAHMDAMYPFAVNPYHAAGSVSPAVPPSGVFGSGVGRGQLLKARAVYRISPAVQGYINLEKLFPGDFYIPQDSGYWFRCEIIYRFKGFVPFHKPTS